MDHVKKTIDDALAKLREQENQVVETKKAINSMLRLFGEQPMFADTEAKQEGAQTTFRNDEFYGQPLTTVVRRILEARKASNLGAASVNEIYDAMDAGGYKFDTSNLENAKRVLRISLTKNSGTFHKLPTGDYGLRDWYPGIKDKPVKVKPAEAEATSNEAEAAEEGFDFAKKEQDAEATAKSA